MSPPTSIDRPAPWGGRPVAPPLPDGLKLWRGRVISGLPEIVFQRACSSAATKDVTFFLAMMEPVRHHYRLVHLDDIAMQTGYSERAVDLAVSWLRKAGLVAVSRWKRPESRYYETVIWLAWRLPAAGGGGA